MMQKQNTFQPLRLAFLLPVTLALAACGGSSSPNDVSTPAPPSTPQPTSYVATAVTNTGGALSPSTINIPAGEQGSFSLSIDEGYVLESISGCNGSIDGQHYITGSMNANCTVNAVFKKIIYTISTETTAGGSINPGTAEVPFGDIASFSVKPGPGFEVGSVDGCQGTLNGTDYVTGEIKSNCVVRARFEAIEFTVSASVTGNGSVSPVQQNVAYGQPAEINIDVAEGHQIMNAEGCSGNLVSNLYTTGPITENCSVLIDIQPISYMVSVSIIGEGEATPDELEVIHGEQAEFEFTAAEEYLLADAHGCNGVLVDNSYTTAAVVEACEIEVTFVPELSTPADFSLQNHDQSVTFHWAPVAKAETYALYIAEERGVTPENYSTLQNGQRLVATENAITLEGLSNEITYYAVVTAFNIGFESDASREIFATPQGSFTPLGVLNDTGAISCADRHRGNLLCPVEGFPNQDAEQGRDAQAAAGELVKLGSGMQGFDFTKLSEFGSILPMQTGHYQLNGDAIDGNNWSCVRDNVTGLIWEIRSQDSDSYRYNDSGYRWHDPNPETNGGQEGYTSCYSGLCTTHQYIEAANTEKLCGFDDWRLPTTEELFSITHYGREGTLLDISIFPDISSSTVQLFWTSDTNTRQPSEAVYVNFRDVNVNFRSKTHPLRVRLVRGEKPYAAFNLSEKDFE